MENNNAILIELAKQFAIDYLSISNINYSTNQATTQEWLNKIFKKDVIVPGDVQDVRNIFVIGAGASYDSYRHIPLANEAIDRIHQNLSTTELYQNIFFKKKVDEHKEKIRSLYGLNPEDFESQLAILSNYIKTEDGRNQLAALYDKKLYPCLFYEILAHLFKHRFIDAIINFNFDELLDQAIEEELSHDDYHYIFSDGQCQPMEDILVNGRLKLPLYIKPHGTISHKSSLKFTKEDYFGLSSEMKRQLEDIISGKRMNNLYRLKRVNVIVVGSSLKSFEFNQILNSLPDDSAIYYFSTEGPDEEFLEKKPNLKFRETFRKYCKYNNTSLKYERHYIIGDNESLKYNKLGRIFLNLYDRLFRKKMFTPLYEPKDIYRHLLINEIFYDETSGKRLFYDDDLKKEIIDDRAYISIRTLVELLIALSKAKFRITIEELMQERFGYYYRLYYTRSQRLLLMPISIHEIFQEFNMTIESETNFLTIKSDGEDSPFTEADRLDGERIIRTLFDKLISTCRNRGLWELKETLKSKEKEIIRLLKNIHSHDSLSIAPKFNDLKYFSFKQMREDNIIPTKLALMRRFLSKPQDWDLVLILSNKAKILLNLLTQEEISKQDLYKGKKCCLITEDAIYSSILKKMITSKRLIDDKVHLSLKSKNNDNLMLFIKTDNDKKTWRFVKGIVYHRINNSFKICPYFVDSQPDLEEIGKIFFREYCDVAKAEVSTRGKGNSIDTLNELILSFISSPQCI
ncbi:MAG: SIR2 family protein [Chitinophagaceae bacterium]|nr:SIR2 family protein [Chitinophagaceae bacterium]